MNFKTILTHIACCFIFTCSWFSSSSHDIFFCGEKIPLDDEFVSDKLMNIIKRQINYVNLPSLRLSVNHYMPQVEKYLQDANMPQDLKYLAIVESGFKNDATSPVGAAGFWQLMKPTAREWGLRVDSTVDERRDFEKSTLAACRELTRNYLYILRTFKISSWVLTAAAYNYGTGNIKKNINIQGQNYFTMKLNPETAAYVYKIIAVKELFEYPELYMEKFGYNIFTVAPSAKTKKINQTYQTSVSGFGAMKVNVNDKDGAHPTDLSHGKIKQIANDAGVKLNFVSAKIKGKYKHFEDGSTINFELEADLDVRTRSTSAGNIIQGTGWIIDNRVMVDLGYGHRVVLLDNNSEKGIALSDLKNNESVILKVYTQQ